MADNDELIRLAKSKPLPTGNELSKELNEAERFVIAFDIQAGRSIIRASSLYQIYKHWSDNPVSSVSFFMTFGNIFCSELKHTKKVYKLNRSYMDFTIRADKLKRKE